MKGSAELHSGHQAVGNTYDGEAPSVFSIGLSLFFAWVLLFFALVQQSYAVAAPAAAVVLVMHGTRFWSRLSVTRIGLSLVPDRVRLFPDDTQLVRVELHNRKILPVWLRLEIGTPVHLLPDETLEGETRLLPYERVSRSYKMRALHRGVSVLGPAHIIAGDLLGLHQRTRRFPTRHEIVVFPRLRQLLPLSIPFQEYFGIHASKGPVEDPAWYAGTRDYVGNRPARNIHWKASARLGVLQEKLYEPTSHRKVLFVLDCSRFAVEDSAAAGLAGGAERGTADVDGALSDRAVPGIEALERSIEAVASVAAALMETGASFGFVTDAVMNGPFSSLLPMGRGPEHLGTMLEMLARLNPMQRQDLNLLLREAIAGAMGVVYFGASPSSRVRALFSAVGPRRRRMLFVFAAGNAAGAGGQTDQQQTTTADEPPSGNVWDGHPSYLTREVIDVRAT